MERGILTYPIEKEQVQDELSFFEGYFSKKGIAMNQTYISISQSQVKILSFTIHAGNS
jgi:hypothetical protein